jgi:hypothetical protein
MMAYRGWRMAAMLVAAGCGTADPGPSAEQAARDMSLRYLTPGRIEKLMPTLRDPGHPARRLMGGGTRVMRGEDTASLMRGADDAAVAAGFSGLHEYSAVFDRVHLSEYVFESLVQQEQARRNLLDGLAKAESRLKSQDLSPDERERWELTARHCREELAKPSPGWRNDLLSPADYELFLKHRDRLRAAGLRGRSGE